MAKKYGTAGTGARRMAKKRVLAILVIAAFFLLLSWVFSKNAGTVAKIGLPGVVILFIAVMVLGKVADKKTDELEKRAGDAQRGARGEEKVAEFLSNLPDGFEVFHDIQCDGFNIDHVVASPAGIFLIETKSHSGRVSAQ